MRLAVKLGCGAIFAASTGCGPSLVVNTDWNPAQVDDMAAWQTFTWLEHEDDGQRYEDLDDVRIRDAIARHLTARGYALAPRGQPADFLVAHHLSVEEHVRIHQPNYYGGWYGWYDPIYGPMYDPLGPAVGSGHVDEWQTGVLVVDLVDPETRELAWRGVAESRPLGRTGNPARRIQILQEAVDEMLADFPVEDAIRQVSQR